MAYTIRKRGRWYVAWKDATGRWRRRATSAHTRSEARRLAADLERQTERQRLGLEPLPASGRMTVRELAEWWLREHAPGRPDVDPRIATRVRKHILDHSFGATPLHALSVGRIEAWLNEREQDGLGPASLNILRGWLRHMINRARRADPPLWTAPNPMVDVRPRTVSKRVRETLRADEVPVMLAYASPEWREFFAAAVWTAMRKGELCGLCKTDVDLRAGTIIVRRSYARSRTKGGNEAVIPIADPLVPYLRDAMAKSRSDLVFPNPDGTMRTENNDPEKILRRTLGRAGIVYGYEHRCRKCAHRGVPHVEKHPDRDPRTCPKCGMALWPKALPRKVRFHDLRHTAATLLARAGVPPAVAQRIPRHSTSTLTMDVYTHVDLADMRAAVNRLIPMAATPPHAASASESSPHVPYMFPPEDHGSGEASSVGSSPQDSSIDSNGRCRSRTCDPRRVKAHQEDHPPVVTRCNHLQPLESRSRTASSQSNR